MKCDEISGDPAENVISGDLGPWGWSTCWECRSNKIEGVNNNNITALPALVLIMLFILQCFDILEEQGWVGGPAGWGHCPSQGELIPVVIQSPL